MIVSGDARSEVESVFLGVSRRAPIRARDRETHAMGRAKVVLVVALTSLRSFPPVPS
jgi:hypothetical protein